MGLSLAIIDLTQLAIFSRISDYKASLDFVLLRFVKLSTSALYSIISSISNIIKCYPSRSKMRIKLIPKRTHRDLNQANNHPCALNKVGKCHIGLNQNKGSIDCHPHWVVDICAITGGKICEGNPQ